MNTDNIERRLESLAEGSADPDLPHAILDRLAQLEAGATSASPIGMSRAPRLHRVDVGGGTRARGLMLLGMAAALALVSGLAYFAGSHTVVPQPKATPTTYIGTFAPGLQDAPPSLGSWKKIYTFSDGWKFGNGSDNVITLSWQSGEIVGLTERHNDSVPQQTCVLQSKDGTSWTCSELPAPTGVVCGKGSCFAATGVAVNHGRWVVVGSNGWVDPTGPYTSTMLTWTSTDGTNWTEQPSARSTPTYWGIGLAQVVATNSGFLTSRCGSDTNQQALWTSTDGTTWQPARTAPGSLTITCATLGAGAGDGAGYMAVGTCNDGTRTGRDCVGYSADGQTWTSSDPRDAAPPALATRLSIVPVAPTYVGGRWIAYLSPADGRDDGLGNYQASSADGTDWTLAHAAWPDYLIDISTNPTDFHPAAYSPLGVSGYWAVHNGPTSHYVGSSASAGYREVPADPSTYWSPTGRSWQPVSTAPPSWPMAVVETPSGLVAIMGTGSAGSPVVSVWTARIHQP
jgi:hypothetical protein